MNDSFKQELDAIKMDTPTSVKADPGSLLYGFIFIAIGVWLLDLGGSAIGLSMILVGSIGVLAGAATFVSESPKVKLIQAIDGILMALLLLAFVTRDSFNSPLVGLGLAGFMVWTGYDDLKEYRQLSNATKERERLESKTVER